jgi:hypothetical protein|tara:strand:- start:1214 stop:2215 length:1002 start_codon:yes stop_codon:yes gene_type:complete
VILIITNKGDIHCNPVIKHLVDQNDEFFRLNTDSLLEDYEISFWVKENVPELKVCNKVNKKSFVSGSVKSVWERRPVSPNIIEFADPQVKSVLKEEVSEFIGWLRYYFSNCRSIGSSVWDRPNESKLRQMDIAGKIIKKKKLGIRIPTTLVTNTKAEMMKLTNNYSDIVVKPIGSDGIELDDRLEMPFLTRKVPSDQFDAISEKDINLCPTFMQNYIDKKYELRITVVGSEFFCCKIDSQKLPEGRGKEDWREGYDHGLPQSWISTPEELVEFCSYYLESINSSFGCFDFINDNHGVYHFLECNPNGQWMWMEADIGIPISEAIAKYLAFRAN